MTDATTHQRRQADQQVFYVEVVDQADFGRILWVYVFKSKKRAEAYGQLMVEEFRRRRKEEGEHDEAFINAYTYNLHPLNFDPNGDEISI